MQDASIVNPQVGGIPALSLMEFAGEPRARDIDIASRLGFKNSASIRKLIRRHRTALETRGVISTVEITSGSAGGRPGHEFWLNEKQALFVIAKSDAEMADVVLQAVIDVFVAWRNGHLAPANEPNEVDLRTNGIVRQTVGKVAGLERAVAVLTKGVDGLLAVVKAQARQIEDLVTAADGRRAVGEYVSVRELLENAGAMTSGRNGPNRKIGRAMWRLASNKAHAGQPSPARRCPHTRVWLYKVDFANAYMLEHGAAIVQAHNVRVVAAKSRKAPPAEQPMLKLVNPEVACA